jgi:hypothetical protein
MRLHRNGATAIVRDTDEIAACGEKENAIRFGESRF